MDTDLAEYDAIALGELIRKGKITPVELLETTIQRIEKINPQLNAVIHNMYDEARDTAKSWSYKIKAGEASKIRNFMAMLRLPQLLGGFWPMGLIVCVPY